MDINKLIKEYKNFVADYNRGRMFKIRNIMRQLSNHLLTSLNECKTTMTANESNEFNEKMNKINDDYNLNKETYEKIIDSYFPYTKEVLPSMLDLLHDDKFNNFDPEVYRDVLNTFIQYQQGDTTVINKVNDYVRKSVI